MHSSRMLSDRIPMLTGVFLLGVGGGLPSWGGGVLLSRGGVVVFLLGGGGFHPWGLYTTSTHTATPGHTTPSWTPPGHTPLMWTE